MHLNNLIGKFVKDDGFVYLQFLSIMECKLT